jgi:hypothetical protein
MIEAEKVNEWKMIEFERADTILYAFRFSETRNQLNYHFIRGKRYRVSLSANT